MSGSKDILIEQLRAEVDRLRGRAEKAERERDEWKSDAMARTAEKVEAWKECHTLSKQLETAERDSRPDISAKDAALHTGAVTFSESVVASQRIHAALHAHAAKARPVCTCSRRLGDYCPTPDPDCAAHAAKAKAFGHISKADECQDEHDEHHRRTRTALVHARKVVEP